MMLLSFLLTELVLDGASRTVSETVERPFECKTSILYVIYHFTPCISIDPSAAEFRRRRQPERSARRRASRIWTASTKKVTAARLRGLHQRTNSSVASIVFNCLFTVSTVTQHLAYQKCLQF